MYDNGLEKLMADEKNNYIRFTMTPPQNLTEKIKVDVTI